MAEVDEVQESRGVLITMATGRVEAFSDGVIAIAATLLVLSIKEPAPGADVWSFLGSQLPMLAAYVTSFVTILIFWVNHHALFHAVDRVDRPMLLLNGLLLLGLSFISYVTAVLGRSLESGEHGRSAAVLYALTLSATAGTFTSLWAWLARRDHLLHPHARPRCAAALRRSMLGPAFYLASAAAAGISAPLSLGLDAAIAGYFALLPRHLRRPAGRPDQPSRVR